MDINFHHLKVFHTVARLLSYSRAAEQLYISQPAVSRTVQDLEKSVGTPVFHRQGKRISLTDAGRRVFDYAQRVLDLTDELEQAVRELEEGARGFLRVASCSTIGVYMLPAFLGQFRRRYPEMEVSLEISNSQQAASSTQRGDCHLGFVSMAMEIPGLQWQTLGTDEIVIVAQSGHPFTLHPIEPDELCDETLLLREQGSGTRRHFELELERHGLKPRRVLEIGNTEAIKRAVAAGLGISAVPKRALTEEQVRGSLGLVRVVGLDMQRPLGILTHKGIRLAPVALAFSAALQKGAL
ncbi:MAG: LysR substrate-binding domain-containing protein [Dehalococcoidia bacterium]|nr:LysR substrate-binding domain-containing protein [Dehalococcoidia bacterium]